MSKTPIAVLTAILAATALLASSAEAGMKVRLGFGGPLPYFTAYGNSGGSYYAPRRAKRHLTVRHQKKDTVKVSKKAAAQETLAKAEPEAKVDTLDTAAETENSSISTAAIKPVEGTDGDDSAGTTSEPAAAEPNTKTDCKKFFPSVGMTLTVPCE